ncbi:hypothetical protein QYF36_004038 [Acer negundo]|nr:hypothetical protein QYF36_004038 [Acer negundo]
MAISLSISLAWTLCARRPRRPYFIVAVRLLPEASSFRRTGTGIISQIESVNLVGHGTHSRKAQVPQIGIIGIIGIGRSRLRSLSSSAFFPEPEPEPEPRVCSSR